MARRIVKEGEGEGEGVAAGRRGLSRSPVVWGARRRSRAPFIRIKLNFEERGEANGHGVTNK
jgi:hypothetical protein